MGIAPSPGEDWAERVLDREIEVSDAPPLVALSDPAGLRVFELGSGRLVYGSPTPAHLARNSAKVGRFQAGGQKLS